MGGDSPSRKKGKLHPLLESVNFKSPSCRLELQCAKLPCVALTNLIYVTAASASKLTMTPI